MRSIRAGLDYIIGVEWLAEAIAWRYVNDGAGFVAFGGSARRPSMDGETARRRDGETARRRDGETGRRGDGETGRRGDGETGRRGDIQSVAPRGQSD